MTIQNLQIVNGAKDFGWAAIVRLVAASAHCDEPQLYVAMHVSRDCFTYQTSDFESYVPAHQDELCVPSVCGTDHHTNKSVAQTIIALVPLHCVAAISKDRIRLPHNLREPSGKKALQLLLQVKLISYNYVYTPTICFRTM